MKVPIIVLAIMYPILAFAQDNVEKPKTINECFVMLDKELSVETKNEIYSMKNQDEMIKYHFSIGLFIRNNWVRHGNLDLSELFENKYFRFTIDDSSALILEGYWAYLHHRTYNISDYYKELNYSYESIKEPIVDDLKIRDIEAQLFPKVYYEESGIYYAIHVYKAKESNMFYIYNMKQGWGKIDESEYKELYEKWHKCEVLFK